MYFSTAGFAAGSYRIDGTVRDACTGGEAAGYRLGRRDATRRDAGSYAGTGTRNGTGRREATGTLDLEMELEGMLLPLLLLRLP